MAKKKINKFDAKKIAAGVRLILEGIGEDPDRDGLKKTPERVADFYAELTEGSRLDPKDQ
ncbi:MAG: GTP cyclohydrolase I, partial [Pyrinomonadaceae bacterium]